MPHWLRPRAYGRLCSDTSRGPTHGQVRSVPQEFRNRSPDQKTVDQSVRLWVVPPID